MCTNIKIVILMICSMLFITIVFGENAAHDNKVFSENGNIFYKDDKEKRQLTQSGRDREPVLSPDGAKVVFTRRTTEEKDQLWVKDIKTKEEKMLVKDRRPDPKDGDGSPNWVSKHVIEHILNDYTKFSPDGKKIYFLTVAWTTSCAVHEVNIDGSDEQFIIDGNSIKVIPKGRHKGNLIVDRHKYFVGGGSYDWYYLVTPEGKEIGTFGDDLNRVDWEMLYYESDEAQENTENDVQEIPEIEILKKFNDE